jgi:hypothetical protein
MPSQLLANITWPALMFYERGQAWWIIAVSIIVEWWIIRRALTTTAAKSLAVALAMNVFSAFLGWLTGLFLESPWFPTGKMPLVPLSGLFWLTYVDHWGSTWSVAVASSAAINTVVEGFFLVVVFRRLLKKSILLWLPIANVATAELTFLTFYTKPAISAVILASLVITACVSLAFKRRRLAVHVTEQLIGRQDQREIVVVDDRKDMFVLSGCADQANDRQNGEQATP